jgi:hypothetical protein
MSTNYYFQSKQYSKILNKLKRIKKECKALIFNFELENLHIGKRSSGWKPCFEKTEYYSSVKEIIEFYEKNKDDLIILDEYGKEFNLEQLKEELFKWCPNGQSHLQYGGYKDLEGYEFIECKFS